ncbi:MAG: hypothetical protein EBT92_05400 [Planctomycetes bacterium]|nr:hypothetical protein [Planctomycetota bacterium]NBY02174.1 hypothetical protein [Planctomycetota bacterium]
MYSNRHTHEISCKIEGFGLMKIKSEFAKKAWAVSRMPT